MKKIAILPVLVCVAIVLGCGSPNLPDEQEKGEESEASLDYNLSDMWQSDYIIPGPTPVGDGTYLFVLPNTVSDEVSLIGDMTGWEDDPVEMSFDSEQQYWWVEATAEIGDEYDFLLQDDTRVGDPFARAFSNDDGNSLIIDTSYSWQNGDYSRPDREDLVIYEMHLNDFTRGDSSYSGTSGAINRAIEKIPYLTDLGVNAVEIMPIQHWPGGWYSWGYMTSGYYAIESSMGSSEAKAYSEFKKLVDALHGAGIAVILDIVYNHTANNENHLWLIDNETYFEGESPWGNRVDFTQEATQRFFLNNMRFLLDEFKLDGFRFDMTDYIDLDGGLLPLVQELMDNGYDDRYYIFEQFDAAGNSAIGSFNNTNNGSAISSWGSGFKNSAWDALDNDDAVGLGTPTYFGNDHDWVSRPTDVINYVSSHDEGTLRSQHTNTHGDYRFSIEQVALGHTHLFTSMGIPMMWMGDEIHHIQYGNMIPENGGFDYENISAEANLVEWDELYNNAADTDDSLRMHAFFKGLIDLRLGNSNLRRAANPGNEFAWAYEPWGTGNESAVIGYSYSGSDKDLVVVLNYGTGSSAVSIEFPADGTYDLVLDSAALETSMNGITGRGITVSGGSHELTVSGHQGLVYQAQ